MEKIDAVVVGAGVVVLERHKRHGLETSSRLRQNKSILRFHNGDYSTLSYSKPILTMNRGMHLLAAVIVGSALNAAAEVYVRDQRDDHTPVPIHMLNGILVKPGLRRAPLLFTSKMTIDADGAGDAWKHDPDGQAQTTLTYADGRFLDPTKIPYFVLPDGFEKTHPDVHLGDIATVLFERKVSYAIYGDIGPKGQVGEGSIALARCLGIDSDPVNGGVSEGVTLIVFPGSGDNRPLSASEIRRRGKKLRARLRKSQQFYPWKIF